MSTKLGWFGARRCTPAQLTKALQEIGAGKRPPKIPEDGFRVETKGGNTSAVLLGWEYAAVHDWARAVSKSLATTTVSFFLLEGCWDYAIHRKGTQLAAMTWYPKERPSLTGDLAVAAAALEMPVLAVLHRYYIAILEALDADTTGLRAYDDDESDADNEWAHTDLARRLGFHYPEPDAGEIVTVAKKPR